MKKIYTLFAVTAVAISANAQTTENAQAFVKKTVPTVHGNSGVRTIGNPDTTGIVNVTDFLPAFNFTTGHPSFYSYGSTGNLAGYLYGNNGSTSHFTEVGQGYQNIIGSPVNIIGALCWFGAKQSDMGSSGTSKVVIKAYDMATNKSYNILSGAFNSSTLNWPGPNTLKASADLLFTDIDTMNNFNYVAFATPAHIAASTDFLIGCDVSTLAAGDTTGLVSDAQNDAMNIDYAFHKVGTGASSRWFVSDELFSGSAATGGLDNDIALWAVLDDATGINEYFNGIKLTTYPNPAVDNVTVEYTLEKNASTVSFSIYDLAGHRLVNNVYNAQSAGTYKVGVETSNYAPGTYLYQIIAGGHNLTKQFVITK